MRFLIMLRPTDTGYCADVPDLPGCVAAAGSLRGTRKLISEAIELHLDMMQQSGEELPRPRESLEFRIDPDAGQEVCTWVEVATPQTNGSVGRCVSARKQLRRRTRVRQP